MARQGRGETDREAKRLSTDSMKEIRSHITLKFLNRKTSGMAIQLQG